MRPTLLDLYCCAGGAASGYHDAGFDVVGVDINPQPRYPFEFIQADVLSLGQAFLQSFAAIHASPPCQFGTELRHAPNARTDHPNLIPQTRAMLKAAGVPYIIENVRAVREHLIDPVLLCGSMFNLGAAGHQLQRHRLFECSFPVSAPACTHKQPVIGVYGGHVRCRSKVHGGRRTRDFDAYDKPSLAREAMGIHWPATMTELSEAIPPAYTRFLGEQLLGEIAARKAA